MSEYKNSIVIGIKIDDINKVKTDLQKQIDSVKGIKTTISKFTLDKTQIKNDIQTQLNSMNFTIKIGKVDTSGIDTVINKTKQASKEAEQFKNIMGKSLNIGDGAKAFDDLQKRANEIRNTVDSLAKINFNTTKNGGIKDATITYTDNMGKLVTETMKWKQIMSEADGVVKNVFTTTNVKVTDNVQQLGKLESRIDSIKSKMQTKLNTASAMGIDSSVITQFQNQLNSINVNTPINKINELRTQINSLGNNSITNINKLEGAINTLSSRINNIKTTKMDIIKDNNITELRTAESEVNRLKTILSEVKAGKIIDGKVISSEVNTARNSVNQLSTAINGVKANASTLGNVFKNIFSYAIGGSVIFAGLNQLRQGLTDIKNIDSAMTDLKRVADDVSNNTLNNFSLQANNMAKSLGNSTESVIEAVTTFKQLGYTWDQAKDYMAKESIILSNVGDMSSKDSADAIVATLKGFKLEAQDTTKVVDSLNEAGNKFAIRTGELAEGLRVSSAALAVANNDLYQSEALITAGTEVLRNSNEVGTGLKTISMRLDQVKTKGGETFFKLKNDLKDLTNTELTNADGSLRSTYEIIMDISKAWNSGKLSDMDKAKILDETAGKNQAKVMASILQNAEKLPVIYETLKNSAGSADQEQARFMDSLNGRLNALKESTKAIWINLTDTNSLKNILSGSTSVVNGLNGMIQKFGAMPTVIMSVVGAMTVFNAEFRKSMSSYQPTFLNNWIKGLNSYKTTLAETARTAQTHIDGLRRLISVQNASGVSTLGAKAKLAEYQAQLALATIGTKALQVATMAMEMAFSMGLSLVITGAITKIMDLANAQSNLKQSNDEYVKSLQQNNPNDHQALLDNYKKLQSELSGLKQGTTEYKDKEQELAGVQEQLISLYPQATDAIDKNTGKKQLNAKATQDLIDKEKQYAQAEAIKKLADNDVKNTEDIKKLADGYTKATEEMKKYQDMYNNGQRTEIKSDPTGRFIHEVDISKELEKSKESSESYLSKLSSIQSALSIVDDKSGKYAGAIDVINSALGISSDKTEKDTKSKINNAEKIQLATNAIKEFKNNSNSLSTDTVDKLNTAYPNLGINAENAKEKVEELNDVVNQGGDAQAQAQAKAVQEASKAYSDASKEIAQAEIYLQKLNKAGAVTPVLAKQMQKTYGDSVATIDSVAEAQDFLTKKIKEQKEIEAENYLEMNAMDENFYQQKLANSDEFKNAYTQFLNSFNADGEQAYEVDFSNYKTYAELKNGTQQDLGVSIQNWLVSMVGESAKNYQIDFSNFKSFASLKAQILQQLANDIANVTNQLNSAMAEAQKWKERIASGDFNESTGATNYEASARSDSNEMMADIYSKKKATLEATKVKVQTSFDNFDTGIRQASVGGLGGTTDFGGGSSGGSGKSGGSGSGKSQEEKEAEKALKEAEEWTKKINELKSDVKDNDMYYDTNNAITQLDNTMQSLKTSEEGLSGVDLVKAKQKETDVMNQQVDAYKRLQSLQEIEKGNIEGTLSQYGILVDKTGNLSNAYEVLAKKKQEAESMTGSSEPEFEAKKKALQQVSDLNDLITKHTQLVNEDIPKTIDKWQQYANAIKKANAEAVKTLRDDLVGYYLKQQQDKVDKLKEKSTNAEEKAKKNLETQKQNTINEYDSQIKAKQQLLEALNDDTEDNEAKLKGLIQDRDNWLKDNSTYSKSHVDALNKEIADLQKTMQKNSIQKEIDSLNTQKQSASDSYDQQLSDLEESNKKQEEANERKYKKMLDEKKAYQKIDEMITDNNEKAMVKLYKSYGESYKEIGSLYGENVTNAFKEKVAEMETVVQDIAKKISKALDVDVKSSSKSSSSSSSSKDKTTTASNGVKVTTHSDGTKSYSNGDYTDSKGYYHHVATYDTGGRTPSNIDDGAIGVLHSDEKILNKDDTVKFDDAIDKINDMSNIDEIYKSIMSTGSVLMKQLYLSNNYSMPNITPAMGMDLSSMSSNIVNNSNRTTGDTKIELYNEFNIKAQNPSQVKKLPNDILKVIKTEIKDLKFNNINR